MPKIISCIFTIILTILSATTYAKGSAYFISHDYYNAAPTDTAIIIPHFKTYQQTTDYSCAAVCVQMLEGHYKQPVHTEQELIQLMHINPYIGVTPDKLARYFSKADWQVEKATRANDMLKYSDFISFVEQHITNNEPILVESYIWGGHWQIIIGLDKLDDGDNDDVLILADPMDVADHSCDGYTTINARQFFYSWFDGNLGPEKRIRQWLVAKPK